MRAILDLRPQDYPAAWMPNHKTEAALRIMESEQAITYPPYILEAVEPAR